jgi:hypothetical protein
MSDVPMTGWAVVLPAKYSGLRSGGPRVVVELGEHTSEKMIWSIALGWPTEGELAEAKMHGAKAFRVRLVALDEPA